jgi:hypothetical protein
MKIFYRFKVERRKQMKLHFEGDNIVTRDGRLVRPLSNDERFILAETGARNPKLLSQEIQGILRRAATGTDADEEMHKEERG